MGNREGMAGVAVTEDSCKACRWRESTLSLHEFVLSDRTGMILVSYGHGFIVAAETGFVIAGLRLSCGYSPSPSYPLWTLDYLRLTSSSTASIRLPTSTAGPVPILPRLTRVGETHERGHVCYLLSGVEGTGEDPLAWREYYPRWVL